MTAWEGAPWTPRAWQAEAFPLIVEAVRSGERAVVSAIMGAGKSVLIAELCHASAAKLPAARAVVVLVPTQALVRQLSATIEARLGVGKVGRYYADAKQAGQPVVVCCNPSAGRLAEAFDAAGRRAGLVVADECHQTQAESVREAIGALGCRYAIGFTATPYRSDEGERLELWDRVAYRYGMADALRDGVLVPWRLSTWDGTGSPEADDVCLRLMEQDCRGIGPGVVSARSIEDAEGYAERMRAAGWRAAAIHSRLPRAERDRLVAELEAGDLEALVHVSLLAEGVDFPWLRWLCMRRPVGARVRFAQEMGRPLRAAPGKRDAVIVDPHDLFGRFGLAAEPALGMDDEVEPMLGTEAEREEREDDEDEEPKMPHAVAVGVAMRWVRSILLTMQAHGLAGEGASEPGAWRQLRATRRQLDAVEKLLWAARYLPAEVRDDFRLAVTPRMTRGVQRGAASDAITILAALADVSKVDRARRRHWRWPDGVELNLCPARVRDAITEE